MNKLFTMSTMPGDGTTSLVSGEARCPGPSVQEIVGADANPPPSILTTQSYEFLGDSDIPVARYTDPEFFSREMEHIWCKTWQWACREEHIPEAGDNYVYEVGPYSIIVVRQRDETIKAFVNSCLHRGTKLRPTEGEGHSNDLRCPYHGWTWNLDGSLKKVPCAWDFPHVVPEKFHLPEVAIGLWGGFVFINLDTDPMPLQDYLGVLPEHFRDWGMADRYVELHMAKELPCNWKTAQEAFLESYHVIETHPQLMTGVGDANVQYDCYGDHVSRFYAVGGVNSPHLEKPLSEQDLVNMMLVGDRSVLDELTVRPGETARLVMARFLRRTLADKYLADLSRFSDSEIIDTIEYHLFPNMILFPGLSLPMVYRFRPIGLDPNRTLFEILFLRPVPDCKKRPEPAPAVYVKENESYSIVPGMDVAFAMVYDQDTNNLRSQQQGFLNALHSGRKVAQTLGNYQEVRIRHFNATVDKYVKDEKIEP
ncbi:MULTISPECIES: Rieske 2Fe-2S domain-containing protein [unclassified Novosphingobium]|uniref:aromatic ring-hydroxylating oxygenase subunit alpha n=1 Tax=unclassified Novosphingobium TaxID=2644732 RepID=UPI0013582558|nr:MULTISPECIES: aromatic ring-hydroxylating dioxygenase subunit alpha [unclassified Novosphingobium]